MSDYETRLAQALTKAAALKDEIAYLRLQIKQEVKQAKWAKGSPIIKQFKACWPDVQIDNGAGLTYLSLKFGPLDDYEPHLVGWELFDSYRVDESLGSPIIKQYRMKGVPAVLYVTKHVVS